MKLERKINNEKILNKNKKRSSYVKGKNVMKMMKTPTKKANFRNSSKK